MDILYLYGFSEMTGNQLERLLPILKLQLTKGKQIGFVLIHDGVIGINAMGKTPEAIKELLNLDISLHAMVPDLKARGISVARINDKIKPIEYTELVDIIDSSKQIISWM